DQGALQGVAHARRDRGVRERAEAGGDAVDGRLPRGERIDVRAHRGDVLPGGGVQLDAGAVTSDGEDLGGGQAGAREGDGGGAGHGIPFEDGREQQARGRRGGGGRGGGASGLRRDVCPSATPGG